MLCQTCGISIELNSRHKHHIVPRALGGTDYPGNIVEICEKCHSLIHDLSFVNHAELIRKKLKALKDSGIKLGRPNLTNKYIEQIKALRAEKRSYRYISKLLGISVGSIHRLSKNILLG